MIDYQVARNWDFADIVHSYAVRDTMLYALGIGMGADPMDEAELAFVYEKQLQAVPSLVSVLGISRTLAARSTHRRGLRQTGAR